MGMSRDVNKYVQRCLRTVESAPGTSDDKVLYLMRSIFSRQSVLQTSLTNVVPWAKGCEPWRRDAVMGTSRGVLSLPFGFQGQLKAHQAPQKENVLYPLINQISVKHTKKHATSKL